MTTLRHPDGPRTAALRDALLARPSGPRAVDDLLFLEAWEARPTPDISAALRARQLRRANPALAAEIREELARGRRLPHLVGDGPSARSGRRGGPVLPPGAAAGDTGRPIPGDPSACPAPSPSAASLALRGASPPATGRTSSGPCADLAGAAAGPGAHRTPRPTRRRVGSAIGEVALATPSCPRAPMPAAPLGRRAALAAAALMRPARAQGRFPTRPIRVLVPFPAGGITDVAMRSLCELAARRLGQPVAVENRPGAGGILGAHVLAAGAPPDGHTLAQMPVTVFRVPLISARPPFDPLTDFAWVIQLTGYLFGTVVRADAPWRGLRGFLDHAKANRGGVAYGSPGVATTPHVTMEQVAAREGIAWIHVPFRGDAESLQALLNGDVQAAAAASTWAPLVEEGRLRLLCTWGAERARRFPDAPTLREVGIDVMATSPYGVAGPRGMEPGVARVLHDAFREALFDPAHRALLERFDMQVAYLDSEGYAAAARRRYEEERELVGRLGLRPG